MSGLEVIGVVASASQLVRYISEIIHYTQSIWTFIKGASCQFQQYTEDLESLISVVRIIRQTPSLQTHTIEHHLAALLNKTEALSATLRRYSVGPIRSPVSKVLTALQAPKAEAQILKDLDSLERRTIGLLLCIEVHKMGDKVGPNLVIAKESTPEAIPTIGPPPCRELQKSTPTLSELPEPHYKEIVTYIEPRTFPQASSSTQTSSASLPFAQTTSTPLPFPPTCGQIFRGNLAINKGTVVNRSGCPEYQDGRQDVFEGNNADGDGVAVLNGHATDELIRILLKR